MSLADIEQTLASMRLRFTRHGHRIRSQCPCHEDTEPSLIIEWRGGEIRVKCFAGCPATKIMEALRLRQTNYPLYKPDFKSNSWNVEDGLDIITEVCAEAIKHKHPLTTAELKRRGLWSNEYGVLDASILSRILMRVSADRLVASGLAYWKYNRLTLPRAFADNRIVIPYWRFGKVVSVRSRRIDDDGTPKYLSLKGYPSRAFIARAVSGSTLIIVEGEFKAMVLAQYLPEDISIIALPGVNSAWTDLKDLCTMYGFGRRLVMFDTERENKQVDRAARKLALMIRGDVIRLELSDGESRMAPDDFILRYGPDSLVRILN